ncbi:uncharacterized protein [Ptychodera flava]|uniref:uncharacterized protein n=1 Tax=Ptychodera flava TaxID=63121 RepID=UPI003969EBED
MKIAVLVQIFCVLSVHSYVLHRDQGTMSTTSKDADEDPIKFLITEDEAWEYLGMQRCQNGTGLQCFFHGSDTSRCFSGIDSICDGIDDCGCHGDKQPCLTDETESVCAWKDVIASLQIQGIPRFGYGWQDSLAFQSFWVAGLNQYCPPDEHGISRLRCHSDPTVCFSPDELCDGVLRCDSICENLFNTDRACPTDEDKLACKMRHTFEKFLDIDFYKISAARKENQEKQPESKSHAATTTTTDVSSTKLPFSPSSYTSLPAQ